MGLVITWLDCKGRTEVILDDEVMKIINPAVIELEAKTGIFLDPYSDTRISPDHAQILIKKIENLEYKNKNSILEKFIEILNTSVKNGRWILALGD